jgi:nitrite reductase/ring-hydroxylating ferredoxin subunit
MKKVLAVFAICAASAMAADVTGYIVDKNCSTKKAMLGNEECAKSCMGKGAPAVLATEDGKVYAISNQDKVKDMAGKKVTVTGKVDGDTVTVTSVALAKT